MDSDDVVDFLEDFEEFEQQVIFVVLDESDCVVVEQLMIYFEYLVGCLMQFEVVIVFEYWIVGEIIDFLWQEDWLFDQFYYVVLVDLCCRFLGYVMLGKLLVLCCDMLLCDIVEDSFCIILVWQDEGDVVFVFNKYYLILVLVVDDYDWLVGIIIIDDVMVVLDEEYEEDFLCMVCVLDESYVLDGLLQIVKQCLLWLVINLFIVLLLVLVIL